MARDWRDELIEKQQTRIVELEAALAERDRKIAGLERSLAERDQKIAGLEAQLATVLTRLSELEEKQRRTSRNSHQPPSGDGPAVSGKRKKKPSGRSPGGQPGHEGSSRELVPVEKVDALVACKPSGCRGCGGRLRGDDAEPQRHQVFELPVVRAVVTEYQLHALSCRACGTKTRGSLPEGVPVGMFGPTVQAVIAVLMGPYRLGKRPVQQLMADLFGLSMSLGAVVGCQDLASRALKPAYEEGRVRVPREPVKYADETSWREARGRAFLWVVVTAAVTVFMVHARRNAEAARALLGRVSGVLVTDRHGAYGFWPDARHQFCWAHLARDLVKIEERGGSSERVASALIEEKERMFAWWHRVRDGTLTRSTFQVYMRSVQTRVWELLTEGAALPHPKTSKTCKRLLKHFDALFTFVYREGVEPTNNTAELRVRHAVLLRKTSYGTHSSAGSRFVERILTVHATLRQQNRSVLEFVRDACRAQLGHGPMPSLLPASSEPFRQAA